MQQRKKTVVIIQARMTSTRLPGKILIDFGGMSVLERVVKRCRMARLVDEVVVASPEGAESALIAKICEKISCRFVSGSEHDVLSRYGVAAEVSKADLVVRVTSDCPLIDPVILDDVIGLHRLKNASGQPVDYVSNTLGDRTYPRGLDVEVFSKDALQCAIREAKEPADREHVTRYFYTHPHKFSLAAVSSAVNLSAYRWTLDTQEDCAMFAKLFEHFAGRGLTEPLFADVVELSRAYPEIAQINAAVEQKKG